jgi:hypothetical protein
MLKTNLKCKVFTFIDGIENGNHTASETKWSTMMTSIELPEEHIIGDNKPWNKKPS